MSETKFEQWCLVELMGHVKIAGYCTEQSIAGSNMLRVDVPETDTNPPFTRLFGSSAIYSINPIDEGVCKALAGKLGQKPIEVWNLQDYISKQALQLPAGSSENPEDDLPY